jgi:hypothetical protein
VTMSGSQRRKLRLRPQQSWSSNTIFSSEAEEVTEVRTAVVLGEDGPHSPSPQSVENVPSAHSTSWAAEGPQEPCFQAQKTLPVVPECLIKVLGCTRATESPTGPLLCEDNRAGGRWPPMQEVWAG